MRSTVEPLEGNKVKVSVEVEEAEFEPEVDAAFRRIAREVRIPGFRPGKAPRRVLEARLGQSVGREEALRHAVPEYYAQALRENDVDAIAPPELEVTAGHEAGEVVFDAVVEVRPVVSVAGYEGLRVEIPAPEVTEADVDAHIERLRDQLAELEPVDRPAVDGDHVTIDVKGSQDGEELEGLTADDYLYEVGSGAVVPELDANLRGSAPGHILEFDAEHPDEDEPPLHFRIFVKEVKAKVLPPVDDELASDVSEFETLDELRADITARLSEAKRGAAQRAVRERVVDALLALVDEEPPEALVNAEVEQRLRDLAQRLGQQGVGFEQYLEATGQDQEDLLGGLQVTAVQAVKADLALRAVADAEGLEVSDDDLETELERFAAHADLPVEQLRDQLERGEQLQTVRSDLRKSKALEWLVEHVELVDPDGRAVDRSLLEEPETEQGDTEQGETDQAETDAASPTSEAGEDAPDVDAESSHAETREASE